MKQDTELMLIWFCMGGLFTACFVILFVGILRIMGMM